VVSAFIKTLANYLCHLSMGSCEEANENKAEKGLHTVEEAITEALVRKCPKCAKPFIKDDGCNKIQCSCGALVCNVCRRQIHGYGHFCQSSHCQHKRCKKCPLWMKGTELDDKAMREAGQKAAAKVREDDIEVDVDAILKPPPRR
jgi:E3 ubiquitin-protein ligase RNF216